MGVSPFSPAAPHTSSCPALGHRASIISLEDRLATTQAVEAQLIGYDACIWAIGVSSVGLDEAGYALEIPFIANGGTLGQLIQRLQDSPEGQAVIAAERKAMGLS